MPVIAAFPAWAIAPAGHYLHWGVISVSVTNLLIIVAMLVLFVLALVLPFPGHRATAHSTLERSEGGAP